MERRDFLKIAIGVAAGATVLAASARAAPLAPHPLIDNTTGSISPNAHSAVTTSDEVGAIKPEQVRWHGHWGWHRHWGWRRRHWGWRHRHWHRHWRRRYW